ncbi:MAG TPA: dTDP-4-dehydrorhamnose reductase [Rhabdochlamydiaceae bacterium]|jgi:dTDP-4-dehydrorhamnose reductase|nr:dTDP-4-dehydrorhamnose reductase [Rhabdochlamydiaceae bacterium]
MKLWITGAKGLVAAAVQNRCRDEKIAYIATSRQELDISSPKHTKDFLHSHKDITHIINCAAYTKVDQAEKEPDLAHQINALGPENLGNVARHFDLKLIHLSSDYVFGIAGERPFTETDPCKPASTYARTKYEGEQRLLDVYPQACILRTSWVFGQGGKNFVSSIFDKIQKEEKIYVDNDQRNRLTYVQDLTQAILSLLCHSGIFHFANRGETSRFEVAQQMIETAQDKGIPLACKEVFAVNSSAFPQLAQRPMYSALDTTKIENLLGLSPRSWETTIKEFIHEL